MVEENTTEENTQLVGLLAQFDDPNSLLEACDQCRQSGFTSTDAFSPFPVHGIDPALGIKRSIFAVHRVMRWIDGIDDRFGFCNSSQTVAPSIRSARSRVTPT